MMCQLKSIFVFILLSFVSVSFSQDMQFTQFNAAPLYLNPGFTGSTVEHRFATSYRNQWAAIPGHYNNYVFSYDYNMGELNSGIGFIFAKEQAGTGNLGNTEAGLLYAYHFKIDNKVYIQPGMKFNFVSRGLDFQKLVFNDQLSRGGGTTSEDVALDNVRYLDVSTGVLVYSTGYWFGMSFNHLNEPNQSLTDDESPLYMKFSAHGGYKFKLSSNGNSRAPKKIINATFQYKSQQKFDQLDLGIYYTQAPFVFGFWYRGIPGLKSEEGVLNNDALALIVGYKVTDYNLNIGYSYDATISRLASSSAGSHEISLIYEIASKKKKRKKRKFVPCAKF